MGNWGLFQPYMRSYGPLLTTGDRGPTLQVISSVCFSAVTFSHGHPSAEGQLLDESFDVVRSFGALETMGARFTELGVQQK